LGREFPSWLLERLLFIRRHRKSASSSLLCIARDICAHHHTESDSHLDVVGNARAEGTPWTRTTCGDILGHVPCTDRRRRWEHVMAQFPRVAVSDLQWTICIRLQSLLQSLVICPSSHNQLRCSIRLTSREISMGHSRHCGAK